MDVSDGSTDNYLLTGIETATSPSISIAGTSVHLPSQSLSTELGICYHDLLIIMSIPLIVYIYSCPECSREFSDTTEWINSVL